MNKTLHLQNTTAAALLKPESSLEKKLLAIPEFSIGLQWGTPRHGHPEGKILFHIKDVLDNVDRIETACAQTRERLRLLAFVHDTFKYQESAGRSPRDWNAHHAVIARRFMEAHSTDRPMLNIIQWHDEAYYCWRLSEIYRYPEDGKARLEKLIEKVGSDIQLYYQFFLCDTRINGKNQAPVKWIEKYLPGIEPIKF
ncbi:MAG: hypothetical protein AB8F74_16095 [Saprospiraceae bacterium]